jgi:hypothetical protein
MLESTTYEFIIDILKEVQLIYTLGSYKTIEKCFNHYIEYTKYNRFLKITRLENTDGMFLLQNKSTIIIVNLATMDIDKYGIVKTKNLEFNQEFNFLINA